MRDSPGLVGALVIGLTALKAWPWRLRIPWWPSITWKVVSMPVNSRIGPSGLSCVGLVVSGGHTSLYVCESPIQCEFLENDRRRSRGAFDKVASLLGLGYPRRTRDRTRVGRHGDRAAFAFPRAFLHDERLLLSFSGLKTAVLYALTGQNARPVQLPSARN